MKRKVGGDNFIKFAVGKDEIQQILPHRGRILLLDVVISADRKIMGELLITEEVCEGHGVFNGQSIFRGSDLYDMAAQLLGVFVAKTLDSSDGNRNYNFCLVKSYGRAFFHKPVFVGETLVIGVDYDNIEILFLKESVIIVTGKDFLISSGKETKARIEYVKIIIF